MKIYDNTTVIALLRLINEATIKDLEDIRVASGLTIAQMSALIGVSEATFYRMKQNPKMQLSPPLCLLNQFISQNI